MLVCCYTLIMHTIVITGGHHNSALVVAQELIKRGHKIVWIGHQRSSQGDRADSAEYLEVTSAGIPFHDLVAARLVLDLRQLILFPFGIIRSFVLLKKISYLRDHLTVVHPIKLTTINHVPIPHIRTGHLLCI